MAPPIEYNSFNFCMHADRLNRPEKSTTPGLERELAHAYQLVLLEVLSMKLFFTGGSGERSMSGPAAEAKTYQKPHVTFWG
jgi:hypothetical protein